MQQYLHGLQPIEMDAYKALRDGQDVAELLAPKTAPVVRRNTSEEY
jgi:hypothetical protein